VRTILILFSHLSLLLRIGLFPSGSSTKITIRATCPAYLVLLALITLFILAKCTIIKFLIIHYIPNANHLILLRSKYSSQFLLLRHPQSVV
jgi:hypothetical protein